MTHCLLDRPATEARPTARDWISDFLDSAGDGWDSGAAIDMTTDALDMALAHTDRPVRMAAHRDGRAAEVRVYAHTSGLPKTEWSAGSPLVEDLLPRLRNRTRHCGAEVRLTLDGAQTMIWFALPRKPRPLTRLRPKS
jgi:hypothetical protein